MEIYLLSPGNAASLIFLRIEILDIAFHAYVAGRLFRLGGSIGCRLPLRVNGFDAVVVVCLEKR